MKQADAILLAARRLVAAKGDTFTTQELVKEAGVALQTFYRYFASKDELLLAVMGSLLAESSAAWETTAQSLPDPLSRLKFYITVSIGMLEDDDSSDSWARFIATTHWRLHREFPDELTRAQRPFVELLRGEIKAAADAGLLHPSDIDYDAWFISELTRTVYHHYAYASGLTPTIKESLWQFCLTSLGGKAV